MERPEDSSTFAGTAIRTAKGASKGDVATTIRYVSIVHPTHVFNDGLGRQTTRLTGTDGGLLGGAIGGARRSGVHEGVIRPVGGTQEAGGRSRSTFACGRWMTMRT